MIKDGRHFKIIFVLVQENLVSLGKSELRDLLGELSFPVQQKPATTIVRSRVKVRIDPEQTSHGIYGFNDMKRVALAPRRLGWKPSSFEEMRLRLE